MIVLIYNLKAITNMGGTESSKDNKDGHHEYERWGTVSVKEVVDPQTSQVISKMSFSRLIQNQKIFKSWTEQVMRIQDSESKETLLLPEKQIFEKAGMCNSSGNVHLTYENFPYVLDSEIKNRKKLNKFFIETQMWYLLYNIIRAGNKFQKLGKKVGDISPHNVVINDDGQIKVVSTCSLPNELDNFQRIIEDQHAKVFLAPEELNEEYINKCQYPPNLDPCKAEVFSIGLTILSSGILEDCQQIYLSAKGINVAMLNGFLEKFRQQFAGYLFQVVVNMLNLDPRIRRKSSEIYNELFPYENYILELEQFAPVQQHPQGHFVPQAQYQVPVQVRQSFNNQQKPYVNPNQYQPHTVFHGEDSSYKGPVRTSYPSQVYRI